MTERNVPFRCCLERPGQLLRADAADGQPGRVQGYLDRGLGATEYFDLRQAAGAGERGRDDIGGFSGGASQVSVAGAQRVGHARVG
jgi:hypothetical protein